MTASKTQFLWLLSFLVLVFGLTGAIAIPWRLDTIAEDNWRSMVAGDLVNFTHKFKHVISERTQDLSGLQGQLQQEADWFRKPGHDNLEFEQRVNLLAAERGLLSNEYPFYAIAVVGEVLGRERTIVENRIGSVFADAVQPDRNAKNRPRYGIVFASTAAESLMPAGLDLFGHASLRDAFLTAQETSTTQVSVRSRVSNWPDVSAVIIPFWIDGRSFFVVGLIDIVDFKFRFQEKVLPQKLSVNIYDKSEALSEDTPLENGQLVAQYDDFITEISWPNAHWVLDWNVEQGYAGGVENSSSILVQLGSLIATIGMISVIWIVGTGTVLLGGRDRRFGDVEKLVFDQDVKTGLAMFDGAGLLTDHNSAFSHLIQAKSGVELKGLKLFDAYAESPLPDGLLGFTRDNGKALGYLVQQMVNKEHLIREYSLQNGGSIRVCTEPTEDDGFFVVIENIAEARRGGGVADDRFRLATQAANEGVWDWDLLGDRVYFSSRWLGLLGLEFDAGYYDAILWFDRIYPDDLIKVRREIDSHLDGMTDRIHVEFRMRHSDAQYMWFAANGKIVGEKRSVPERIVGVIRDITSRKRDEERMVNNALYDHVTGLPSRPIFLDRLKQKMADQKAVENDEFAIMLIDIDRFQVINDSLGHDVGDELLVDVARRLEEALKPEDTISRLGADQFAVILNETRGRQDVIDQVSWLQSDFAAAFYLHGHEIFLSACFGISLPSTDFETADDGLRGADIAMNRAKDRGHGNMEIFNPEMRAVAKTKLQFESDLRRAIEREEIVVYYQPIVDLKTGRIKGFESLVRWMHSERGMISPVEFIPLAEDTGLIHPISMQVMRQSCAQMKKWRDAFGNKAPDQISVNLSPHQLADPGLVTEIAIVLAQTGLEGHHLKIEITESAIMNNPQKAAQILLDLKELGAALSIDDFGTGYSSLSYLHHFPFDTLKVDREFVMSMDETKENLEIIRTISLLAHNLGMDVIAEGVELIEHVERLRGLECEFGQGYYFSRPVPADMATKLIEHGVKDLMPVT